MEDYEYMGIALEEARGAQREGEIPVGAVVVRGEEILARDHNRTERLRDPTAHAEILAIRMACLAVGDWRLDRCRMYVTLEPCPMCAGAICLARMERLIFGAVDSYSGAGGTVYNVLEDNSLNHRVLVRDGIREEESKDLLRSFFEGLR